MDTLEIKKLFKKLVCQDNQPDPEHLYSEFSNLVDLPFWPDELDTEN